MPTTTATQSVKERLRDEFRALTDGGRDYRGRIKRFSARTRSKAVLANPPPELDLPPLSGLPPKHQNLYRWLSTRYPGFEWEIGVKHETKSRKNPVTGQFETYTLTRRFVLFRGYPTRDGLPVTLTELVVEDSDTFDHFEPRISLRLKDLTDMGLKGAEFAKTLVSLPISMPPLEVMPAICAWLNRALSGEPSTIYLPVCPDYEVGADGRYTFSSLGTGVGLVAKRALAVLPRLWQFCDRFRLPVTFMVAIGDFEANSEETLRRVGVTKPVFLERLRLSQEAFLKAADSRIPLKTPFVTEMAPGWNEILLEARALTAEGKPTGLLDLSNEDWRHIVAARRSLYERWYGGGVDVRAVLGRQGPEYGAAATIAEKVCPNLLFVGSDAPAMGFFWQCGAKRIRPVVYLRGVNY